MKTKKLEIEVIERRDKMWMLCIPMSSVRIGETDCALVKKKECVDYLRHVPIFTAKSRFACKKWLDEHQNVVVKLGTLYEVA